MLTEWPRKQEKYNKKVRDYESGKGRFLFKSRRQAEKYKGRW